MSIIGIIRTGVKIRIFPIAMVYGRDLGFLSKIGRIPTKSGWLDGLSSIGNG